MLPIDEWFSETKPNESYQRGIVLDNNDPEMKKRLKVRIPGFMEGDKETLPWCVPIGDAFLGDSAQSAEVAVPAIGSEVVVSLPTTDASFPFYIGSWQSKPVPAEFQTNYPNRHGRKDNSGTYWYNDQTTGEFKFKHSSGFEFTIKANGDFTLKTAGNGIVKAGQLLDLIAATRVSAKTPMLKASQEIMDEVRTMSADREIYNTHIHQGYHGPTSQPLQPK